MKATALTLALRLTLENIIMKVMMVMMRMAMVIVNLTSVPRS